VPLYLYRCPDCRQDVKKILTPEAAQKDQRCKFGHQLERQAADVSVLVKEVIDNGLQPRQHEQLVDAHDLLVEREEAVRALKNKGSL
jgi:hypothetical protein